MACFCCDAARCFYLFRYSLFMIRNFKYFTDKFWLLNEILEQVFFIFKINTHIISIHIDVGCHNTNLILSIIKMPLNVSVS